MANLFNAPALTRKRIFLAFTVAIAVDAVQMGLGPIGWGFFDEILDGFAMILICLLIGFHPLLLPTFALEILPVVDMLPTWTGCVALVVSLKQKVTRPEPNASPATESSDYIDV